MEEIQLSVMTHSPQTEDAMRNLLAQFEAQTHIRVRLWLMDWVTARSELNRVAMYQQGPDISEVGTTWVADQVSMNALRPFSEADLRLLGGSEAFAPACWSNVHLLNDPIHWAVPWMAETYAIHYRRDLLRQAGIDEATAFTTHAALEQTAWQLAQSGIDVPVELPVHSDRYGNLHSLASWVWGGGGEFCTSNGKRMLFDQPQAQEAIVAYLSLMRHLSLHGRKLMREKGAEDLFRKGLAAIAFGTLQLRQPRGFMPSEVLNHRGIAPLPSPAFVGGSGLVIWRHTHRERAALELARFLTSSQVLQHLAPALAALSPRLEDLAQPAISADPATAIMARSLPQGRAYPAVSLWGVIEERLVNSLLALETELLAAPQTDTTALVQKVIEPAAKRLTLSMAQTGRLG